MTELSFFWPCNKNKSSVAHNKIDLIGHPGILYKPETNDLTTLIRVERYCLTPLHSAPDKRDCKALIKKPRNRGLGG